MIPSMLLLAVAPLASPAPSSAGAAGGVAPALERSAAVFLSREEALALAFPECDLERKTFYPTEEDFARASKLAGFEIEEQVLSAYVATKDGELVGTAWFDVHEVRTKKESVMLVVDPERHIKRIEILAFAEPSEYLPRAKWYAQFVGKRLDDELRLDRGIKGVTGATLTARATTNFAREMLALHEVVFPPAPEPEPDSTGAKAD